ncbi:MAG: PD40 domain-containing protein [Planctomycetes bacterium]|nr:PD40 domain-containing protein [Planctomycetota bacterium]
MPCCNRLLLLATLSIVAYGVNVTSAADPVRLTHDGRQKSSPVFRNEGRELVYVDFTDATLFQLRRLVLADGTSDVLHSMSAAAEFEPTIAADGEAYAHLKLRGVLSISIVVRDKQGTVLNEIQPGPGFCGYRSPTLAPDHSRIAFSYAERGTQQIFSSALNGDDRRPLTDSTGINNWPSYSHDGRSIVFGSSRDGNFEIYRMNADGTNVQRLTDNPWQDSRPRFSPDGQRIAFTSHRDGNAEIYTMHADGSHQHRITENDERDDFAEWHLDGKQLVMVGERDGKHDLYQVTIEN